MTMKNLAETASLLAGRVPESFPRDTSGFSEAKKTETIKLDPGDNFDLRAVMVRKRLGNAEVKMFGYNGSIPGTTLKVPQGSEVTVNFTNHLELDTTVHWHGLRLDNRFDDVPEGEHHGMQAPIPTAGSFTYRLRFPDPGVYWYHPHIREDHTQELGLYGNIIVAPSNPHNWSLINRKYALTVDLGKARGSHPHIGHS